MNKDEMYLQENQSADPLDWIRGLNASGYAGCNPNGNIVDRREFPKAVAVQKNSMFGIVAPKPLYECEFSDKEIQFLTQEEIDEAQNSADEFDGFLGFSIKKVWK